MTPVARELGSTFGYSCPSCGKGGFKDDIAVARHMNQPRSGCSTWLQDIIQLQTDYSMNIDDPHMPHDSDSESHQDHYHDQPEGLGVANSDKGVFTSHINEEDTLPTTDLFPSASQTYGKGHTFLDLFHSNENSVYCMKNLYYPFSGRKEWEVVSWLLRSGLSMGKINSFLSLEMIKDLSLLFSSAKELRGRAEMLPSGLCWMSQVIPTAHPTKSPVVLYWCDPLDCISSILNHPTFHRELDFTPCRVYTTAQRLYRVYSEWMTADDAWKMQSNLPSGATLLGTILSSDKTNISMMTGDRVAHPLLISLANICMSTRLKASLGVLEDCLIHQYLDIVLAPLKQAAREGVMLSDPVGHTVVWERVAPNNIEVFFHEAQKFRLNGVNKPFWLDWVMAEPSHFITPEILHHLHQAFYGHDAKWIICAVWEVEIDFRFSVLQPVTGFRHFHSGISKLKQSTRIEDCDLQRILTVLAEFHTNKQAILDAELFIDNWYIPKLELMQSITPSIRNTGVAMQWTANTTEHAHVTEIKDPAQASNNNNYNAQICCHLDRADKCRRFELTVNLLDLLNQHAYLDEDDNDIDIDVNDDCDILATVNHLGYSRPITDYFAITQILLHKEVGTIPQPLCTFVVGQSLADFLRHKDTYRNDHIHAIGGARRAGPDASLPFDKMQIWFKVQLQDMDVHNASIVQPAQTLNCAPPYDLWTSGQYDTVIVNHEEGYSWPADGLQRIAQIRLIMRPIGKRGAEWLWKDRFLTYVQQFDIGDREPATRLHLLKRAKRSNRTRIGDIIPVTQFRAPVNVVPRFGASADNRLTPYNSTKHSSEFWLNRYWDKNTFFPLSM
ncbi:hypothetical protein EV424DRAFT_1468577 [Suillus variegatus]|nr:hypothetical protein EV424DRAFT_1468577 [Suillus variegatus]